MKRTFSSEVIFIEAKVDKVFGFLQDLGNLASLLPSGVRDFSHEADRCTFTFDALGKERVLTLRMYELVRLRTLTLVGSGDPFHGLVRFETEKARSIYTTVQLTLECEPGLWQWWQVRKALPEILNEILARLKEQMEASQ